MKNRTLQYMKRLLALLPVLALVAAVSGQTTVVNYQGNLIEAGNPVDGTVLFEFKLFDAAQAGNQVGPTLTDMSVTVTQGTFAAQLDFGAVAFPGASRFLEISVRQNVGQAYTVLSPRQQIYSSPYSVRSLSSQSADLAADSLQLEGISAAGFVQQDAGGNVSITGGLTVAGSSTFNTLNALTQFDIGGNRVLSSAGNSNLFVGSGTGRQTPEVLILSSATWPEMPIQRVTRTHSSAIRRGL
jgi:hypothetical protein